MSKASTNQIQNQLDMGFIASTDPERDKYYKNLLSDLVIELINHIGAHNTRGLLISGAVTRGEATIVKTAGGYFSLSDIDLYLIPQKEANISEIKRTITSWVVQKNQQWGQRVSGIDVSVKTAADMRNLAPTIATYELKNTGYVVWGDRELLNLIPNYNIQQINPQDCLRLLHNRTVEQLVSRLSWNKLDNHYVQLESLYRYGKLLLDLMTCFLFLEKIATSSYKDRIEKFTNALEKQPYPWLRSTLGHFIQEVQLWYKFKISGAESEVVNYYASILGQKELAHLIPVLWLRAITYVRSFWIFVVNRVCNTPELKTELADMVNVYYKLESLPHKWVRWLKFLRHPYLDRGLFSLSRMLRLSFLASPLLLSYITGLLTYFSYAPDSNSSEMISLAERHFPLRLPQELRLMKLDEQRLFFIKQLKYLYTTYILGRKVSADE